ncbi:MAG: 4-hydroxy-tetrahydrodipicolinate synthase [Gaiellaceae bacterium]|jgi:4-hydroxy-tetrahydrodipicolinate synthase|nr:4-hydroxy-tetrahydrodipicolinate synthase [Gaiellaceae bacterium]
MLGEVLTAILTPFHPDGSVNVPKFRELAAHLVDHGSDGVVVAGTTGESPTLTDDEKVELFAAAVDAVGDRATVVAGTGTYDTAHSVHLTQRAHDTGVDGILVVTPYYNKPPQRAIVRHFQEIAAVTDKPVVVYNIPSRVVVNIEPETIAELAKIPNVRAVKQAHDDLEEARRIPELGLDLYAGDDNLVFPFLGLGGLGGICVHTHVWGRQTKEMIQLYRSGDVEGARALNEEMAPAFDLLKIATNPIPIKAAMNLLGHELGGYRLPMVDPTEHELEQVRACLERAGSLQPA